MKTICGIDPGLTGGLAVIGPNGIVVEPMPVIGDKKGQLLDLRGLMRWLSPLADHPIDQVFLEMPGSRPGQSVQSTMKTGRNFGGIEGVLVCLGISYEIVPPKVWCKVMHAGIGGDMDPKDKSRIAVARLFPKVNLLASERCKVVHEGMMDALLIAAYGVRALGNGNPGP